MANNYSNMKKVVLIIFAVALVTCIVCGCSSHMNAIVQNNMSDMRINFYEGKNDIYYATLSCGFRESEFAYDGVSTSPVECGVITIGFFADCTYSSVEVILNDGSGEVEYVLERSPYEDVFMEDIGKIIDCEAGVAIKLKNQEEVIELQKVSNNFKVDYKKAIELSVKHYAEKLEELYSGNTLGAECYLKIVSKVNYEQKFWYFSIMDNFQNNYSLLINVNTGEILDNKDLR